MRSYLTENGLNIDEEAETNLLDIVEKLGAEFGIQREK